MRWSHLLGACAAVVAAIMITAAISDDRIAREQQAHLVCYSTQGRLHHDVTGPAPLAQRREWLAAGLKGGCPLAVQADELICPVHGRPDPGKLRPPGLLKYPGPFKLPADLLAR